MWKEILENLFGKKSIIGAREIMSLGEGEGARVVALEKRLHAVFGRSLRIRQVDAGSCNACEWECTALTNPVYDIQRFGIDFVASPRHADALLVTGPVSRQMELALRRTWLATPEPKLVIACGDCALDGGIYRGSYAVAGGVAAAVPVDCYIPGCPPSPRRIMAGVLSLLKETASLRTP
jgi:Ni,Fe-hydrogenase III small subunit